MKNVLYAMVTISVLFVVVSACRNDERIGNMELARLDSLAQYCPDSALTLLGKYADTTAECPKKERMHLQLIALKAQSYAFRPLTNDSMVTALVDYYENEGDKGLLPLAYYYAGKTFYTLNDMPQAMAFYLKTIETADKDDHELLGRAYNQMGYVYDEQMFDDDALAMYKKALEEYEKARDTVSIIYALRDISTIYRGKDNLVKAIAISGKAKRLAESVNNEEMRSSVCCQLADAYYLRGDIKMAWNFLKCQ
jgi:tetratricopeptide (TPR) repeat protein